MCVYVPVCVYARSHTCVSTSVCVCVCEHARVCMRVCCVCLRVHAGVYVCVCSCVGVFLRGCVQACVMGEGVWGGTGCCLQVMFLSEDHSVQVHLHCVFCGWMLHSPFSLR